MLTSGLGSWTPCPVSVVLIIMASLIILFTWCGPHMSSFGLAWRRGCELVELSYGYSEEAILSVTSPELFHMKTNHSSELQEICCFSILSLVECAKSKSNQQYKREKKAFNKAWAKKLLMTQKEDDNKSLGNFSSSTSCLNWQEWTHFSQLRRGKGRTSIQAGSNLPWNNTSSKISPSPLMLQRLQSLESTKIQFPLTPD